MIEENNAISIFKNTKFGSIRVFIIDGEPMFVGRDVALCLGYSDTVCAVRNQVDKDDRIFRSYKQLIRVGVRSIGFQREWYRGAHLINESGMYSMIFGSTLPIARLFKRWVTREVLPEIRKSGLVDMNTGIKRICSDAVDLPIVDTYTYLISDQSGLIKIGRSTNVEERIKQLSTGNPTISLLFIIDGDVERILHKKYDGKRVAGEWFNLSEYDIKEIKQLYN